MTITPAMSPLYLFFFLCTIAVLPSTSHLIILISVAQYAQPFMLEYFKDWLTNRRK